MASELQFSFAAGRTTYVLVRNVIGQIWNGSAFVAYNSSNYSLYTISATEQGAASGFYTATFPSAIVAGVYYIVAKNQTGGSPAETDATAATGDYQWNGTNTLPLSDLTTSGQLGNISPIRMAQGVALSGFIFKLVSAADHITPFLSGICSGQISRNGAGFVALQSGVFNEIGLGFYKVNLTSGDLNATTAAITFTATGVSGGQSDSRDFSMVLQKVSGSM